MRNPNNPPLRAANWQSYDKPAEPSPRLAWWLARIDAGWRPNRRISGMGYYGCSEWYGVTVWEYLNVLSPRLVEARSADEAAWSTGPA